MTKIKEYKKGKLVKEIDITPIEKIRNNLEEIIRNRKSHEDRSNIEHELEVKKEIRRLNKDQLIYLTNNLLALVNKYADLYQLEIEKRKDITNYLERKLNTQQHLLSGENSMNTMQKREGYIGCIKDVLNEINQISQ